MANINRRIQIKGQTSGTFKTQTMNGRDYLVVPVVAMVEGVRYGANQDSPELGLASEFGRFPDSWNNRPIVLGHPVVDGEFVSAGSPAVMEEYFIGFTMAARVHNKKLKVEAWLEKSMRDKSDESQRMFERVEAGEEIEVSVGFFTEVEAKDGVYANKEYTGIWRNVASDHLAFLAEGGIGACSYADGCGAPRVNQAASPQLPKVPTTAQTVKTPTQKGKVMAENKVLRAIKNLSTKVKVTTPKPTVLNEPGLVTQCACTDTNTSKTTTTTVTPQAKGLSVFNSIQPQTLEAMSKKDRVRLFQTAAFQSLMLQAIPDGLMSGDVNTALNDSLGELYIYAYVMGFTNSVVVFQAYMPEEGWCLFQQSFNVDADGAVTFTGEPEEVRLITRIVPAGEEGDMATQTTTAVPEPTTLTTQPTTEESMTTATSTAKPAVQTETAAAGTPAAVGATPTTPAAASETTAGRTVADIVTPVTLEAYIGAAPAEIQEFLAQSVKASKARKDALIAHIKKNKACSLSDTFLAAQNLETLESLAKLATVVQVPAGDSYAGIAAPTPGMSTQETDMSVPEAPRVFARPGDTATTTH